MELLVSSKTTAPVYVNNTGRRLLPRHPVLTLVNINDDLAKSRPTGHLNNLPLAYKRTSNSSPEGTTQSKSEGFARGRRQRSPTPERKDDRCQLSPEKEKKVTQIVTRESKESNLNFKATKITTQNVGAELKHSFHANEKAYLHEGQMTSREFKPSELEETACPACSLLRSKSAASQQPKSLELQNKLLQDEGVDIPTVINRDVSRFVPNSQINPVDTDDEQTYSLYEESFIHNCRLEHMVMVMALHPQYLQQFLDTNFHLLQSKGALPFHYRSYVAIMAAARHRCTYLVHLMEAHFLLQGGDRQWLRGIDHVPAKLRALSTLNKLLAHRPWLVTPNHIRDLVDGDTSCRWQHAELAQAIVLLCHFHGLAVFCHGSGINLEVDHETAHAFHYKSSVSAPASTNSSPSSGTTSPNYGRVSPVIDNLGTEQTGDVEVLMERMKRLREEEEEVTREEMNRRFEKEKDEASHSLIPGTSSPVGGAASFARYVVDPDYSYQEFAKRDVAAEIPTFREQDYTWGDHACLVVRKFYSDVADLLDVKFNIAQNLTYKTLASKDNVDTTSLRRAVWMYVHCMYGIMYDDYNYGEVNQLLERPLKLFIKTASCFPEKTTRKLYDGFWKQFRHSEKIHVTIMIMESRLQVGLLYGMRALTEFLRDS